jgi:hypothetical protein
LSGNPSSAISHKTLLKHFGQPLNVSTNERLAYDPGDPMEIITNWKYRGFRITTIASKPKPDDLVIEEGEISGANVSLLFGVRVGQPIDQWVKIFGRPKCSESHVANSKEFTLVYEPESEILYRAAQARA